MVSVNYKLISLISEKRRNLRQADFQIQNLWNTKQNLQELSRHNFLNFLESDSLRGRRKTDCANK